MEKNTEQKALTLEELKQLITERKPVSKMPTAKMLIEGKCPVVASKTLIDGSNLQVFKNGYVLYRTSRFYTVFHVDQCGGYTYNFRTDSWYLPASYFADRPWVLRLQMEAERRIVHNQEASEEAAAKGLRIMYAASQKCNETLMDFVEELMERTEVEEVLSRVTEKQRRVIALYFYEGYTHQEIAKMLGVTKSAVTHLLAEAKKRINP